MVADRSGGLTRTPPNGTGGLSLSNISEKSENPSSTFLSSFVRSAHTVLSTSHAKMAARDPRDQLEPLPDSSSPPVLLPGAGRITT